MTEPLFFDSDCVSAFLWVDKQSILSRLYPGRIVIPKPVYDELSNPSVPHLKSKIDALVLCKEASICDLDGSSEEYRLFLQMTTRPKNGHKIIGDGEAASLVLAKKHNGIIASNNLSDIMQYISDYKLKHTTTGDILVEALNRKLITEENGNAIWSQMLQKRRKLGALTFSDYLARARK